MVVVSTLSPDLTLDSLQSDPDSSKYAVGDTNTSSPTDHGTYWDKVSTELPADTVLLSLAHETVSRPRAANLPATDITLAPTKLPSPIVTGLEAPLPP